MYISAINTWASADSPLAQLVQELDLCSYMCVIQSMPDRLQAEPINTFSSPTTKPIFSQEDGLLDNTQLFWRSVFVGILQTLMQVCIKRNNNIIVFIQQTISSKILLP